MSARLVVFLVALLCISAKAQVLQSPGSGIPGKVVASFARGNDIAVLFVNTKGTYTAARWENNQWNFSQALSKPNTGAIPVDRYNYTSIAVFNNEIYVGGYLDNHIAADNFIDHLRKWDGSAWVTLSNVIKSKINGITALDVFEGRLICAGLFSSVIGITNVENIAAFDGSNWAFLGNDNLKQGTNGKINRLTVIGNRLYICGSFTQFAGTITGNIAYYTSLTASWGGIGSPFVDEALQIASFNVGSQKYITGLGINGGNKEVRIFTGSGWSSSLGLDSFDKAEVNSIAGLENYLLLGGSFIHNSNATSLMRYDLGTGFSFTGNRISDTFFLHQSDEDEAYAWGNFKEQNTGIRNFAQIIPGYGHLWGALYGDADQNCSKTADEKGLGNVFMKLTKTDNGKIYMLLTKPDGSYNIALPEGNYSVSVLNTRHWQNNSCDALPKVYIKSGKYSLLNIGQFKLSQINDINIQLIPLGQFAALPGKKVRLQMAITNLGSTEINGATVYLRHPQNCTGFSSIPAAANYNNDEATYSLVNLKPDETQVVFVELKLPANATQNEMFAMNAYVGSQLNGLDVYKQDNRDTLKFSSDLSFVPNAVHKRSEKGLLLNKTNRELIYLVTFENISTETVSRVILTDTIANPELFGGCSLLSKSHNFNFSFTNNTRNIIKLVLENAEIPSKEADYINSAGYIKFLVNYNSDLPEDKAIANTAYADFDNKWSGVSETVLINVYNPYANAYTAGKFKGRVYPVPATAQLNVEFTAEQTGEMKVFSVSGSLVQSQLLNKDRLAKINTSGLASGIYLLQTPAGSIRFTVK